MGSGQIRNATTGVLNELGGLVELPLIH